MRNFALPPSLCVLFVILATFLEQSFFCEKCGYNGIVAATILPFQNPESLSCGLWALDFILHKSWGLTTAKYIARFHGNDYLANEKVLASRWGGDISALRFKFNDLAV